MEAAKHTVRLFLPFCLHLEYLQLLGLVYRLPIVVEDGRSIQRLGINLVTIVVQPDDNGVQVEYDLHILCLLNVALRSCDGECDEVIPIVLLEPGWSRAIDGVVTPVVQGESCSCSCIWGFIWVVSVCEDVQEWVLSWVEIPFAHAAGGTAPRAVHCRCTDRHSASRAAILALLLAMAFANCSSLHVEHTFLIALCDMLGFPKRNWYRDFFWVAVCRSPNVGIDCGHVCLTGGGCPQPVRV